MAFSLRLMDRVLPGVANFLAAEKKTWMEHTLNYDAKMRESSLIFLDSFQDGRPLYLGYELSKYGKIEFQHWFVTDQTLFLEFGGANMDIYSARVNINNLPRQFTYVQANGTNVMVKMDENVRTRMRHVLEMCNYSLCLRNCEHVANYVIRERWVSSQMDDHDERGVIMRRFRNYLLGDDRRQVNTFPAAIRPLVCGGSTPMIVYDLIRTGFSDAPQERPFNFSRIDYYLDYNENTINMLIVGPTGAGKSHLINVLFNREICHAEVSHRSVTKDILFIRGTGAVYNVLSKKYEYSKIVVADTVGLCDTDWDDAKVLSMIKGRISSNVKKLHFVMIVYKADRLEKAHVENIKKILDWLKYRQGKNHVRFLFVGTHAEYLTDEKKDALRKEATEIFSLKGTDRIAETTGKEFRSLVYIGFPPEDSLNDETRKKVLDCWLTLRNMIGLPSVVGSPLDIPGHKSHNDVCNLL